MALKVAVDTNIFLNVKNREEPYYGPSKAILDNIDESALKAILSTVVVAEMCYVYHAAGELKEKDDFLTHVLTSPNYTPVEISVDVADEAGRIRAVTGLRLPDALIVASGLSEKADYLVTYNDTLRKAKNLIKTVTAKLKG